MPSSRPRQRWRDIVEQIDLIRSFTVRMDAARFAADVKTRFAVERALLIIAEAVVKLGAAPEKVAPELPWRSIRGIGNQLRHAYDTVDPIIVWDAVSDGLEALRQVAAREAGSP